MKKLSHSIRIIAPIACAAILFGTAACAKKQSSPFDEKSTFVSDSSSGDRELNMTVTVVGGKTIHYEITCKDHDTYMFGNPFTLEYKSGDDWYVVPEEVVDRIAARANSNFALGACMVPGQFASGGKPFYYGGDEPRIEPYGSYVDMGKYVPIGKVVCRTALGRYDNSMNNTILKSR